MNRGLLINVTGNGKGKTTGCIGMAIRALGWGQKVAFLQFVKDQRNTGEKLFFAKLNDPNLFMEQVGGGFSIVNAPHKELVAAGWRQALAFLTGEKAVDLLILDEINIALHYNWLNIAEVIAALQGRPAGLTVMLSGRYAAQELLDICDLVSEVKEIKHPYNYGVKAQKGIDF